jgi:hypothetical protein
MQEFKIDGKKLAATGLQTSALLFGCMAAPMPRTSAPAPPPMRPAGIQMLNASNETAPRPTTSTTSAIGSCSSQCLLCERMMPSSPSYKPQRLRFISRPRVSKLVQAAGNEPRRLGREAKEMWEIFRARAPGYQLRRPRSSFGLRSEPLTRSRHYTVKEVSRV